MQYFDFGETVTIPQQELYELMSSLFAELSSDAPLFLVMHDPRSDLVALQLLGIETDHFHRQLHPYSKRNSSVNIYVLDTQSLYVGWSGEKRQAKLETCCNALKLDPQGLHNAGNDAA